LLFSLLLRLTSLALFFSPSKKRELVFHRGMDASSLSFLSLVIVEIIRRVLLLVAGYDSLSGDDRWCVCGA
jgi:hypothetical protein